MFSRKKSKEERKEKKRRAERFLNEMAQWNDFVLIGKKDLKDQQEDFIKKLKAEELVVEEEEDDGNIYYGLRANKELMNAKLCLPKDSSMNKSDDVESKRPVTRILIVESILNETKIDTGEGLEDLMKNGVFEKHFCLYEEERKNKKKWAKRFLKEMAQWNDFVLIGKKDLKDQQEAFIKKLKEEELVVEEEEKDDNIYYGLRANKELMNAKLCLPKDSSMNKSDDVESKRPATRIRIVDSILNETKIDTGDDLEDLIKKGVFETKFCLYEEERKDKKKWAKRFLNEMAQRNDFVLIGKKDLKDQQEDFIKKLKEEPIEVEEEEEDGNIYYGLRAYKELINDDFCLPKDPSMNKGDDVESKCPATRIIIVESFLNKTKIDTGEGLEDLMEKGVFKTKFCLYEEERKDKKKWAKRFLKEMAQRNNYILVGKKDKKDQQVDFIKKLKEKQIEVEEKELDGSIYYGLRSTEEKPKADLCFSEEDYVNEKLKWLAMSYLHVAFTLDMTWTGDRLEFLTDLMKKGVFETKFYLHEDERKDEKRRPNSLPNKMEERKDKKRRAKRFLNEMAQWNDFVLVGKKDQKDQQEAFIGKLREKKIKADKKELDGSIFYGQRAKEELKDDLCLSEEPSTSKSDDVKSKRPVTRIIIVDSILKETKIDTGDGLEDLMKKGVFEIKFCLYEEKEKVKQREAKRVLNEMAQKNDYVLRGEKDKKKEQEVFIKKLKEEQIEVEEKVRDGNIFYGLRVKKKEVKEKQSKENVTESNTFATSPRLESILNETEINTGDDLDALIEKGVFEKKFCLYEQERKAKMRRAQCFLNEMAQRNDFVLRGEKDLNDQQEDFIKKLKEEQIVVEREEKDDNIYYGLRANKELMNAKLCLPKDSSMNKSDDVESKRPVTRIIIVESILKDTKIDTGDDLEDLIKKGVFEIKFCLNKEERKNKKKWAKRFLNEMAQWNDFVLVGEKDLKDEQRHFTSELIWRKNIKVEEAELDGKMFYGLRASEKALKENQCLSKERGTSQSDDVESKSQAIRIRLVNFILNETKTLTGDDLEDLMEKGVFEIKFCLNEALLMDYYYILVGKKEKKEKQKDFIKKLEEKNIKVKPYEQKTEDGENIFYGLRAEEKVFKKYQYLLRVSDTCNNDDSIMSVSLATRIRIVHFILNETKINTGEGLKDLMDKGVFEKHFCLPEENHQEELKDWVNWKKPFYKQPFKKIRKHFGEKVALYYLWQSWYTTFLIPAAVLGLLVFLCGMAFFDNNPLIEEVCDSNITMCPRCEKTCPLWNLKDTCTYAKISYLFDNSATVAFSLFMAFWATTLLELWKRYRAKQVSKWEVYDWNEEEEELVLELVNDPDCKPKKRYYSFGWHMVLLAGVTVMMLLIIGLVPAFVVFRVTVRPQLLESTWQFIKENANTLVSIFGAVLHTIAIQIMNRVNRLVSLKLSELDKSKSRSDREKTFTIIMFTFQFFTMFSSLFYIAFFLGRINGYPGNYSRIAGYRLEECHPSGCLSDLFIQMSVIMTLSQFIRNISEVTIPWLNNQWKEKTTKEINCFCKISIPWPKNCCGKGKKVPKDKHQDCWKERCDDCLGKYWKKNYELTDTDEYSLFYEILKMVIQFSFTTLFVAAFPLAPLMALINNVGAIRLAAIRMVRLQKLLIPKKTNSIGVWTNVLEAIGVLAVITNGLVIGVTSNFIPRLVYRYGYGPCARNLTGTHCMSGYINSTLTTAYLHYNKTDDFVRPKERHFFNVTECSFRDFRNPDDHSVTSQYWWVLAARFIFIIAFEHLLLMFKAVAAWFVPSESMSVKNDRLESKLGRLKREQVKNGEKV
ncbi:uncharacterized protein LOC105357636 isoform X3 [Oryzias latipes]